MLITRRNNQDRRSSNPTILPPRYRSPFISTVRTARRQFDFLDAERFDGESIHTAEGFRPLARGSPGDSFLTRRKTCNISRSAYTPASEF